jgi:hypothetical protein
VLQPHQLLRADGNTLEAQSGEEIIKTGRQVFLRHLNTSLLSSFRNALSD